MTDYILNISEYIVSSLGLVSRSSVHYLICVLEHDPMTIRWLPLQRFTKAEITNEDIVIPNGFSLNQFLNENSLGFLMSDKKLKLELIFENYSGFHLLETPLNETQNIEQLDNGKIRVRATVADTSELRFWISGFAQDVEVIKPKFLRKYFQQRAQQLYKLYK